MVRHAAGGDGGTYAVPTKFGDRAVNVNANANVNEVNGSDDKAEDKVGLLFEKFGKVRVGSNNSGDVVQDKAEQSGRIVPGGAHHGLDFASLAADAVTGHHEPLRTAGDWLAGTRQLYHADGLEPLMQVVFEEARVLAVQGQHGCVGLLVLSSLLLNSLSDAARSVADLVYQDVLPVSLASLDQGLLRSQRVDVDEARGLMGEGDKGDEAAEPVLEVRRCHRAEERGDEPNGGRIRQELGGIRAGSTDGRSSVVGPLGGVVQRKLTA